MAWAGVTGQTGAWLRCEAGWPVRRLRNQLHTSRMSGAVACSEAELFMCPCHGGVYYKDGTVAAGPPPRPLTRYPVRVNQGQVEILTTPTPIA